MSDHSAHWAVAYHCNSHSPRAKKWYYISRVVRVDGKWFELYWHPSIDLRGNNRNVVRNAGLAAGLGLLHGVFTDAPAPRTGSELQWSLKLAEGGR